MENTDQTPVKKTVPAAVTKPKPASRKTPVPEIANVVDTQVANVAVYVTSAEAQAQDERHVVSGNEFDDVYLSSCVFKNRRSRKSLTIHHMQRRLISLGYGEARSDPDGYFGDETAVAVAAFRKDNNLTGTEPMDAETFEAIFKGDTNVKVVID
jgi:hypothetical protein